MANRLRRNFFQRFLHSSLGEERDYYRLVVLPQSFIFVLLVVLSSLLYSDIVRLTVVHLSGIGVVLLWSLLFRHYLYPEARKFSAWILAYELGTLFCVLLSLSLLFTAHPLLGYYLPVGLILGACVVFDLTMALKAVLVVLGLGTIAAFYVAHMLLFLEYPSFVREGGWIIGFSLLLLVLRPRSRSVERVQDRRFELSDEGDSEGESGDAAEDEELGPVDELEQIEQIEWDQLFRYARKEIRKEFASEFSWRLGGIFLFFATTVLLTAFLNGAKHKVLAIGFLLLVFLYAFSHHSMLRTKRLMVLNRSALAGCFIILLLILLLQLFQVCDPLTVFFLMILFELSLGILPWEMQYSVSVYMSLFVAGFVLVLFTNFPTPILLFGPIVLLFSCRNSFLSRLGVLSRVVPLVVSQRMGIVSTRSLLQLLAYQMTQFVCSNRAVIIIQGTHARVVSGDKNWPSDVDEIFCRGMIQRVKDFGRDGGLLMGFNKQFHPPFRSWFRMLPRRLLFVRLTPVLERKAEEVLILVPYTWSALLAGQHRLITAVSTASSLVRVWTMAAKSRFLSSDVILTSQRSLKESEHELNQVVHRVNNVAQDVSIQCEELREIYENDIEIHGFVDHEFKERIDRVLSAVRFLSTGVSDVKLIKELLRVRNYQHSEKVRLEVLIEELRAYGDYLSFQFGTRFDFHCEGLTDARVLVASRELLEACLRMAMRLAYRERAPDIIARVSVTESEDDMICFMVEDNGEPLAAQTRERILEEKFSGVVEEPDYLRALVNLARLSGGEMKFAKGSEEFANGIILKLPLTREEPTARIPRGDWVLLVDDNPDVTTFYSRIADALELPHETADSLGAARGVLMKMGRPKLVITDVQLGDGSGLELVQEVRAKYGPHLPVFVVSGETDTELVSRVKSAGADLYLTKPVGRRKLFAEIRNVLR